MLSLAILSCKNMRFFFLRHPRYWASRIRTPESGRKSRVLLRRFEAFEGNSSVKMTASLEREEMNSSWRQCTLWLSSPHSWDSSPKQDCIGPHIYQLRTSIYSPSLKCISKFERIAEGHRHIYGRLLPGRIQEVAGVRCILTQGDYFERYDVKT